MGAAAAVSSRANESKSRTCTPATISADQVGREGETASLLEKMHTDRTESEEEEVNPSCSCSALSVFSWRHPPQKLAGRKNDELEGDTEKQDNEEIRKEGGRSSGVVEDPLTKEIKVADFSGPMENNFSELQREIMRAKRLKRLDKFEVRINQQPTVLTMDDS